MVEAGISIHSNLETLSRAAAELFVETARGRIAEAGKFCAALSGGSTPRRLYELLATSDYASRIDWPSVELFQVDERCVPPDDPESNFRMIREAMLMPARIPSANFHRMAGEHADAAAAAQQYSQEIDRGILAREADFPRFDLILLGMGADGHTASLFPGAATLEETHLWVCPSQTNSSGRGRITLTFPILNAAARVIFLVAGVEKARTLRRVLEGPYQPRELPAQRILPVNGQVTWYIDQAAASRLRSTIRSHP